MQAISVRIVLIISLFAILNPSSLIAASEQRTALVIGNSSYAAGPLKNPVNDATDIAATLKRLGFDVILKKNAGMQDMENAIHDFGSRLKHGGEGLFFYAGHGVQIGGKNYLIPIGAKIDKETDAKYQAIDAEMVLDEMANAGNSVNIMILDACRDNPLGRSLRSAGRGLAIISDAPQGMLITYSTSPGKTAADGEGRNSPYTAALIKYMTEPGQPVEQVFKKVRQTLTAQSGGKQIPWELSSLQGNFFFAPGLAGKSAATVPEGKVAAVSDELDDENRKLETEQLRLEEEKAAFAKKKAIDEKRQQIAEEKERLEAAKEEARQAALERKQAKKTSTLAMAKRPSQSKAGETARDGRFIAYSNGTVLDTRTNLMWAAKDNGADINWQGAKSYCENYRGGGYSDWRMPAQDELAGLYDAGKFRPMACNTSNQVHVATKLINISCFGPWASASGGYDAFFNFNDGMLNRIVQSDGSNGRALPVRSGK